MFENALITRVGIERQVDLGLLAETIFFYRSVQMVLNGASVVSLAKTIPADDLIALLSRPELKLSYVHQNFGVISTGMPRVHEFGAFTFGGKADRKSKNYRDEIAIHLERTLGSSSSTRKLVNAITRRTALHRFSAATGKEKIIPDLARSDITDDHFVKAAVRIVLQQLVPTYSLPEDFKFEIFNTGQGYAVGTDLDFSKINNAYHRNIPPSHSSVTPEYILTHILDARLDSYLSAHYLAEIVTGPIFSEIMRLKHFEFLKRREINTNEIELFRDVALPDMPSIREAINSGARNISDFLRLLDNAERFRSWLEETNADAGLVRSYYQTATQNTWADKLPTKTTRFVVATGLGVLADMIMPTGIGTLTGVSVGAVDSFFVDRLIKGWRPNQFIEGPYRQFVIGGAATDRKIA